MRFRDRARVAWHVLTNQRQKAVLGLTTTWEAGQANYTLANYGTFVSEGYGRNTLVYACIREKAQSAAEASWKVYRGDDPVPDHRLQDVLDRPNTFFSPFELWELLLTYLDLDGNGFLLKERSTAGLVVGLWPMRPDLVYLVEDTREGLLGYRYWTGGEWTLWLPEDVIHFRYPHPGDDLQGLGRGLSPLAVAARETDVDNAATDFLKKFFDNAAVPFGLLKSKQQLVDSEIRRIRARLKSQYAGMRNWHEIMILDADAEYQRVGMDMDEMAFPDLRSISESRICMAFEVPPILVGAKVGLDRSTFSNYGEARRAFWEDTLSPLYKRIEDKLNTSLAYEFGDKRLKVKVDLSAVKALQEKRDQLFGRANQGVTGGWLTVNDARTEAGFAPVDGGDVFLRTLAIEEIPARVNGQGLKRLNAPGSQKALSDEGAARFGRLFDRVARAWESRFQERAEELLTEESRVLVERLSWRKGSSKAVDWVTLGTDVEQVLRGRQGNWREGFIPLFQGVVGDQGDVIAATFGIDFSLQNPMVVEFIRDYSFRFAEKVSETAADEVRRLTEQAQDEGWDILTFMDHVEELYSEWTGFRAEMIARSETIRSSNAGAVASYRAAGVTEKQWWTAEDERVCPFCGKMHKQILGIDAPWWSLGQAMEVELPDEASAGLLLEFKELHPGYWGWSEVMFETRGKVIQLQFNYEDVFYPPLHPLCRCTILPVMGSRLAYAPVLIS